MTRFLLPAVLLVAAPLAAQVPLTVRVAPGAPAYDFYGHGPYRPAVPRPDTLLGHAVGTRHTMYHQQQAVLDAMIAAAPDRVRTEVTGTTHEGKVMRVLVISSPANLARLDGIRADLAALADPRTNDRAAADAIIARTPAVAFLSHSIHGNEPAGFEAAMLTAYTLLASESPLVRRLLDSLVVVINPSQNPDGHERFAGWYNSVGLALDEPAALEGSEPWAIQGRFNHRRHDMNRDLLAFSQPETRATAAAVLRWRPQVFVDLHSTTSQYFFPPAAAPINANLPASTSAWLERVGRGNAAAFDRHGWQYYVRDVFDLFYPGYWDTWPSLVGAIGMTFESDGGPRLMLRKDDGTVTSFREGIAHHVVASMATLETLAAHRAERLRDYRGFFESALVEPSRRAFRRVVIAPGPDPVRTREVVDLLRMQGIEVRQLADQLVLGAARSYLGGAPARRSFPAGSYLVDLAQPQGRLATAILEPSPAIDSAFVRRQLDRFERNRRRSESAPQEGYEFYDITAWALPLTHGLDAVWTDEGVTVRSRMVEDEEGFDAVLLPAARSGYLIPPGTRDAQALALALLREGFVLGVATAPLVADGNTYPTGTIVMRTVRNPDSLHARLQVLMRAHPAAVVGVASAFPDSGQHGIGGEAVRPVRAPKILVAAGDCKRLVDQLAIVGPAHVGKSRSEPVVVDADERVVSHEIDMVVDDHHVATPVEGIHAADGAGDHEQFGPHRLEDANGEGDRLEWISLVHMEATFHGQDRQAFEFTADEAAAVTGGSGAREVGNVVVIDRCLDIDLFDQPAQSRTEDHSGMRRVIPLRANCAACLLNLVVEFEHGRCPQWLSQVVFTAAS